MKKLSVFLLIIFFVGGGSFLWVRLSKQPRTAHAVAGVMTATITPSSVATPISIVIPTIQLSASIESVGLDSEKRMDVPKNPIDVAWYNLGPKPGEYGQAVIDGHVDLPTGAPSTFADLKDLHVGDKIIITDTQGKTHTFTVNHLATFPTTTFPVQDIFGSRAGKHLNLITCAGQWDVSKHTYNQRLVVFADLLQ